MKNPQESAKAFATLIRKIGKSPKPVPLEDGDPVSVLVMSFLMWEATSTKATTAYKRLSERVVDFNDLRVSMPDEMVEWIGPRYPMAFDRCQRLRAALRHTYKREHAVSFDRLNGMGRREIKRYLRSLDGIAAYVADRVTLLCYDAHCIPVDDRLRRALVKGGVADESIAIPELGSWLARQVKASDAVDAHRSLQAWSDRVGTSASARTSPRTGKTRRKKTAARQTARSRGG